MAGGLGWNFSGWWGCSPPPPPIKNLQARREGCKGVGFSLTGAVPTAFHTVEDLLLQFLPLRLLRGEALSLQLGLVFAAQDFAVLGVPQVRVQTGRVAEEGLVVAPLHHFTLLDKEKYGMKTRM